MVRKSIGLALLAAAIGALIVTTVIGSVSAQIDPFTSIPYYPYAAGGLPSTGEGTLVPGGNALLYWAIPALIGASVLLVALAFVRMRSRAR